MFAVRRQVTNGENEQHSLLRPLLDDIAASKKRIRSIIDNKKVDRDESTRAEPFLHVLRVFETELLCRLREWGRLLSIIEEVVGCNTLALSTLEAITDILWVEGECPIDVLFAALEAILHASLDRSLFSIDKFSRWLRAICSMLLSRNSAADRAKAIGYVEQAIHVIENQATDAASEGYPLDERQWLLGTSYNTGIECLHASLLDEAKRWFEASTTICRFLPDGNGRAEKISETYTQLLERYTKQFPASTS